MRSSASRHRPTRGARCRKRPACACRASTSAAATRASSPGYESFGVQNQARVVTEGVDHTEGVGGTGFYEDYYANEEVSVSSLGSDVEMNSPGAAVVSTIKSGGNKFKGLENFAYEPGSFVGSNAARR